jgi:predicted O-methyltransferase YrrM
MEQELDFTEDVLRHCGGRLTTHDADLLFKTASEIEPKNILEIGSMDGCSTMILGSIARETKGLVQCIEPAPKQKWRHNIERLGLQKWVHMHFATSPWFPIENILDLCKPPIVNKMTPLDYLFIDGDHRTRWAIVDYHFYMPYVRIGGRIAFHDWWDQHDAGKWVREAVEIIMRDDEQYLKMVGETRNKRGLVVYEKTGDHNRHR